MTDREGLNELERWMKKNDPTLDGSLPGWVWDLTAVIDDILIETGRLDYAN